MKDKRKISEMLNLGEKSEEDLNRVGIYYAYQVKKLGAYKVFKKMVEGRLKAGISIKCINAVYLYAFYGAIHDIDWMDIPEEKKDEFKKYTSKIRKTGRL